MRLVVDEEAFRVVFVAEEGSGLRHDAHTKRLSFGPDVPDTALDAGAAWRFTRRLV